METGITLFDDKERVDRRPARRKEPLFDYLNNSDRRPVTSIRELIEAWFLRYPDPAKQDLRGRFRSKKTSDHLGAFFELYLHELLCSMGFGIQVHPDLSGDRETHPDFLVLKGGSPCFCLEATLEGPSQEDAAEKARIDQVYDTLNKMHSPNFFLVIRIRGAPATPPPAARLRRELERWLSSLDPEEIEHRLASQGFDSLPSCHWRHDGWDVHFTPVPKPPDDRESLGVRPIGSTIWEMERIYHPSIRKAVGDKATKYGELDVPFVVAVNVIDIFMRNIETMRYHTKNELFGKPNSAWFGPHGPQNKGVSAVLVAAPLDPWEVANRTPVMIHNPWAARPCPPDLWPLPQWVPNLDEGHIDERPGKSAATVLSLPCSWPPPDDPEVEES